MAASAERRKIVVLATAWGSKYGGINAFNMDLVKALASLLDSHYDVVCVALNADAKQVSEAKSNNIHLISLDITEGTDVFSQHLAAQAWHKIGQTFAP